MEQTAFDAYRRVCDEFRARVAEWTNGLPGLADAQRQLATLAGDSYEVQTPVVYNLALDDVRPLDDIRWIVVADNPGKREQEAGMNRYLVGRSGLATERFFRSELGVDLRKQVVIINKTPIHTPRTAQLRKLGALYPPVRGVLHDSQCYMAAMVQRLTAILGAKVWVMGLSEIRPGGLFEPWARALVTSWADGRVAGPAAGSARPAGIVSGSDRECGFSPGAGSDGLSSGPDSLYLFNHFSMGSFATDLKRRRQPGESTVDAVLRIGAENRSRLQFGTTPG